MISVPADAWPLVVGAADEFGGQDWVNDAPAGEANYRLLGGKLPQADFNALDDRFLRRYFEVVAGRLPHDDAALRQMAEALGLTYRVHFDKRPALPAPHALSERLLAELAEDYSPDLVMIGADRVLGPWADEPISREVRRYAASLAAFIPCMDEGGTAVARWSNLEPPPSVDDRAALRNIQLAPPTLWSVDGDRWTPLLEIAPRRVPTGPVQADFAFLTPCPARFVVARVYRLADESWRAFAPIVLPAAPSVDALRRRLTLELWRVRRVERRTTWDDMLRRRADLVYRLCASAAWRQRTERPCLGSPTPSLSSPC
ncbi:MAG: hypothetical protein IPN01_05405 [Deltaproteobacteria bacterium]|nr:hypothetical protein [Deltaproteobacteria bacterium]